LSLVSILFGAKVYLQTIFIKVLDKFKKVNHNREVNKKQVNKMKAFKYDINDEVSARMLVHSFIEKQDKIDRVAITLDKTGVTFSRKTLKAGGYDIMKLVPGKVLDFRIETTETVWKLSKQDVYNVAAAIESGKYDEASIWKKFNNKFKV
jgi:hypothetical protein